MYPYGTASVSCATCPLNGICQRADTLVPIRTTVDVELVDPGLQMFIVRARTLITVIGDATVGTIEVTSTVVRTPNSIIEILVGLSEPFDKRSSSDVDFLADLPTEILRSRSSDLVAAGV